MKFAMILFHLAWLGAAGAVPEMHLPNAAMRSFSILPASPGESPLGGFFAHDLDGDGKFDFLLTWEGGIAAFSNGGEKMWLREGPIKLFEYTHHPSAIAGDLDGDGKAEVAALTQGSELAVLDGATGEVEYMLSGLGLPIAIGIANLRGLGDRDVILQYDLTHLRAIRGDDGSTLWETNQYKAIEHSPFRQADLDGDGLDEVAGAALIDHDGKRMNSWELDGHHDWMDSIVIADIEPGGPLEVALAEQRGALSHTDVVNADRILWRTLNPWDWEDPDKLAVGDFDPDKPGLEVFNRSSGGDGVAPRSDDEPFVEEEAPWVLDAQGGLITKYYVNDKKPDWWTGHGLEEICRIDWNGDGKDLLVGKERHRAGAGAIFDAISGDFLVVFPAKALRIYAADIEGDSREEVIVLDESGEMKIFRNTVENRNEPKPSPWTRNLYRRQKQNWNYYSP